MTKFVFLIIFCLSTNFINSAGAVSKKEGQTKESVIQRVIKASQARLAATQTEMTGEDDTGSIDLDKLPPYCRDICAVVRRDLINKAKQSEIDTVRVEPWAEPVTLEIHKIASKLWTEKFQSEFGEEHRNVYDQLIFDCFEMCDGYVQIGSFLDDPDIPGLSFDGDLIEQNLKLRVEQQIVVCKSELEGLVASGQVALAAQARPTADVDSHRLDATSSEDTGLVVRSSHLPSYYGPIALELQQRMAKIKQAKSITMSPISQEIGATLIMRTIGLYFDKLWTTELEPKFGREQKKAYEGLLHDCLQGCPEDLLKVVVDEQTDEKSFSLNQEVFAASFKSMIHHKIVNDLREQTQRIQEDLTAVDSALHAVKMAHHGNGAAPGNNVERRSISNSSLQIFSLSPQIVLQGLSSPKQPSSYIDLISSYLVAEVLRVTLGEQLSIEEQNFYGIKLLHKVNERVDTLWKDEFGSKIGYKNKLIYDNLVSDGLKDCCKNVFNVKFDNNRPKNCIVFDTENWEELLRLKIQEQVTIYRSQQRKQDKEQQKALEPENKRKEAEALALQQALLGEKNVKKVKVPSKKPETQKTSVKAAVAASLVTNASTTKTPQVAKKPTITAEEMQRREQQSKLDKEKKVRCKQEEAAAAALKKTICEAAARSQAAREEREEIERQQRAAAEAARKEEECQQQEIAHAEQVARQAAERQKETLRFQAELEEAVRVAQEARERAEAEAALQRNAAEEARRQQRVLEAELQALRARTMHPVEDRTQQHGQELLGVVAAELAEQPVQPAVRVEPDSGTNRRASYRHNPYALVVPSQQRN